MFSCTIIEAAGEVVKEALIEVLIVQLAAVVMVVSSACNGCGDSSNRIRSCNSSANSNGDRSSSARTRS